MSEPFLITLDRLPVGSYVYALADPRDELPFYVGKGKGRRVFHHEREARTGRQCNPRKHERLASIAAAGLEPLRVCIADGLDDVAATRLERSLIHGNRSILTNATPGQFAECERVLLDIVRDKRQLLSIEEFAARNPSDEDIELYVAIRLEFDEIEAYCRRVLTNPAFAKQVQQRKREAARRSREWRKANPDKVAQFAASNRRMEQLRKGLSGALE